MRQYVVDIAEELIENILILEHVSGNECPIERDITAYKTIRIRELVTECEERNLSDIETVKAMITVYEEEAL